MLKVFFLAPVIHKSGIVFFWGGVGGEGKKCDIHIYTRVM